MPTNMYQHDQIIENDHIKDPSTCFWPFQKFAHKSLPWYHHDQKLQVLFIGIGITHHRQLLFRVVYFFIGGIVFGYIWVIPQISDHCWPLSWRQWRCRCFWYSRLFFNGAAVDLKEKFPLSVLQIKIKNSKNELTFEKTRN